MNISKEEFGILAICAERYALGRRTYMPGLICEIIKRQAYYLKPEDREILIRDIEYPVGGYGDSCDKEQWMNLLQTLKDVKNGKL